MATSAGRRLYSSKCSGRGHLRTRYGMDMPRGYEKRIPGVLLDKGEDSNTISTSHTKDTVAIACPDGVTRTLVRVTGTATNQTMFVDWVPTAGAFTIPKWALGVEWDLWTTDGGYATLGSTGLYLDVRPQNGAGTQVLNGSSQLLAPGWNRVFLPKESFTALAGAITFADGSTSIDRIRFRAGARASHTHQFVFGPLRWAGRSRGQVCVMFDDNRASVYDNAFAIMRARGIPGTMFSNSDFLAGGVLDGLDRMTQAELLELKQAGWEVYNHGADHAVGYGVAAVAVSQAQIEDGFTGNGTLMGSPHIYASPFGDYSADYWTAASNAGVKGFRGLWQSDSAFASGSPDMWLDERKTIPAVPVADTWTTSAILATVDGVAAAGGTLNLLFHGIEASGGAFYSVANFTTVMDGLVAASRRNNYDLVTFSKAYYRTCM